MLSIKVQLQRNGFLLDVEFELRGRTLGVFGPSGAGKSTLMHLISGLEKPDRGAIRLDSDALADSSAGIFVPPQRRRIGIMFQDDRLFPHYKVEGNLRYGERLSASRGRTPQLPFEAVIALLELKPLLERRVIDLSGGERQRVALGRTLLSAPRLLLLDEPFSSLDTRLKQQILPMLKRVREEAGVPMLYVSHDLTEILQLTNDVMVLDRGKIAGRGEMLDLAHQQSALDVIHERDLMNVIELTVAQRNEEPGAMLLASVAADSRLSLTVPLQPDAFLNQRIIIGIHPRDISLASHRIEGISIQNQIPGKVVRLTSHASRVLVEIDIGVRLLAEVSVRAVQSLGLEPGAAIWCLIKSNAIRCLSR